MSYLPRISKTYREPPLVESQPDQLKDTESSTILKPASSLVNEKTFNPLMALKHYKYFPHKPPVLPGPSVAEEAAENELFREAIRLSIPSVKSENISSNSQIYLDAPTDDPSKTSVVEDKSLGNISRPSTRNSTKKSSKGNKVKISKKKLIKTFTEKKGDKSENLAVSMCLVEDDIFNPFLKAQINSQKNVEWNKVEKNKTFFSNNSFDNTDNILDIQVKDIPRKSIETINRSIQCGIFGSTDKTYVIPPAINALLSILAFLLNELNKDELTNLLSAEGKRLMNHIQLLLCDLCNHKITNEFGFDIAYSDSKRMEKIYEDLKQYLKTVYGNKEEFIGNFETLKKMHIQLEMKELELEILNDKLKRKEEIYMKDVEIKENELKNPEISYQNKILENEQLTAEKEFGNIELRKCQKSLAEINWEIQNCYEELNNLKRVSSSKSKIEIISRNFSCGKFPGDVGVPQKLNWNHESEEYLFQK